MSVTGDRDNHTMMKLVESYTHMIAHLRQYSMNHQAERVHVNELINQFQININAIHAAFEQKRQANIHHLHIYNHCLNVFNKIKTKIIQHSNHAHQAVHPHHNNQNRQIHERRHAQNTAHSQPDVVHASRYHEYNVQHKHPTQPNRPHHNVKFTHGTNPLSGPGPHRDRLPPSHTIPAPESSENLYDTIHVVPDQRIDPGPTPEQPLSKPERQYRKIPFSNGPSLPRSTIPKKPGHVLLPDGLDHLALHITTKPYILDTLADDKHT